MYTSVRKAVYLAGWILCWFLFSFGLYLEMAHAEVIRATGRALGVQATAATRRTFLFAGWGQRALEGLHALGEGRLSFQ